MNHEEFKAVIAKIENVYQGKLKITDPAAFTKSWYEALKNHEYSLINKNLDRHIQTSSFVPTPADLVAFQDRGRAILNAEETKRLLDEEEARRKNLKPISEDKRKKLAQEALNMIKIGMAANEARNQKQEG